MRLAGVVLLALMLAVPATHVGASRASFTATSANPGQTVATAADFNTVAVSLSDPGSPLRGTLTVTAAATSDRGIASVTFQIAQSGSGAWSDACVDTAAPYSCSGESTVLPDGLYDVRAVAVDDAGYSRSDVVTARRLDNTAPAVALTDPGAALRGSVTLASTATDAGSGVASVRYEYRTSPSGAWQTACTAASAPFSCAWATGALADGLYDLRATATDGAGNATASAVVSARRVDNTPPAATDVQGANGGTAGKVDAGDTLTFTYGEQMAPAGILAGWSGAATAVQVKLANSASRDLLAVWDAAGTTRLALTSPTQDLQLNQNWVSGGVVLNGTMSQSGGRIVVTIGTVRSGSSSLRTGVGSAKMTWTPSVAATDLAGNPCSATAVDESGTTDVDF